MMEEEFSSEGDRSNCLHSNQVEIADRLCDKLRINLNEKSFNHFCRSFADTNEGNLIKKLRNKKLFLFSCKLGHKFLVSKKQILAGKWCCTCDRIIESSKIFAEKMGGKVISQKNDPQITFQCHNGHLWNVNYEKACTRWCKECCHQSKKVLKEMIADENRKIEDEKKIAQNKLLEEARLKFQNNSSQFKSTDSINQKNQRALFLEQIEKLAERYTMSYLDSLSNLQDEIKAGLKAKYFEVYRVIIMPSELFKGLLMESDSSGPMREFRRFAIMLHPDKNDHPNAKFAFQKLYKLTQECLKK